MLSNKRLGLILVAFSIVLIAFLSGVKADYDKQAAFLCDNYHLESPVGQCPAHTSNASWLILGAFGIATATLISGGYLVFYQAPRVEKPDESKSLTAKNFDASQLEDEEKQVYSLITESGGSLFQGDIIRKTGFSKVRVSRILDKLELSGAIERKRRGMANLVVQK